MIAVMDVFRGVIPFIAVAETRSYRKAGERLGVTSAAVSKAILALEKETRTTLFLRTSRRVELTEDGERFFERCREALGLVQAGREALSASRRWPTGKLAVSSSFVVARLVVRAATEWKANYPDVSIELRATDRMVRFASENVDVGVRVGGPGDDSVVVHELRKTQWVTVASPAYLARKGAPRVIADLARHECVRFVLPRGATREWTFGDGRDAGAVVQQRPDGRMDVDHGELLTEAAEAGAGVCQVLDFMVRDALHDGRLVEVLASHRAPGPPVLAVHLPEKRALPRVRTFLEQLRTTFQVRGAG